MPRGRPPKERDENGNVIEASPGPKEVFDVPVAPAAGSPEFQKAVNDAVQEALAKIASIGQPAGVPTDMKSLFSQMAMSMAEIADQGTNRKKVAPEILAQRAAAAKECEDLVLAARARDEKPEYRVRAPIYFNERWISPYRRMPDKSTQAREIVWTGIPNDALVPINDAAIAIYAAFRRSVGMPEKVKGADNRPYWVTAGGLTVKGDAPSRVFVAPPDPFTEELVAKGETPPADAGPLDPNAPTVPVLGTVHPQAVNTAASGRV